MVSNVIQNRPPWVFKRFVKDKFFVRERYWRQFDASNFQQQKEREIEWFIPNGISWRKYLKLIIFLSEHIEGIVLLESAVELMDWRNAAPCLDGDKIQESTAVQERGRIRKLVESAKVTPFCDLSIREEECDEFDILEYSEMDLPSRCEHALTRAGRMLSEVCRTHLIVDHEDDIESQNDAAIWEMERLLDYLRENGSLDQNDFDEATRLLVRCREEYELRNSPKEEDRGEVSDYLNEDEIRQGIAEGTLLRGRLEVSGQNSLEGFVKTSSGSYFIDQGKGHFNRSFHQDVVVIKPLPEGIWGRPVGRRRLVFQSDSGDTPIDAAEEGPPVPSAIVVAIAHPARRKYVATLLDSPSADERAVLVVPMSPKIPKIRIQTKVWHTFIGKRLLVDIDHWERTSNYPHGHCVEILGPVGDLETEVCITGGPVVEMIVG